MHVALYARVSTVRQAEKDLSIPDQLRQMQEWCRGHGHTVVMEYIEPGASATDDKRPVFQQMIAEATLSPSPYEAIIVHSLSRFFRDSLEFGLYERRLNKAGVQLISITQQTSSDPAGEMARKIFSLFDEYQSKENGKHTLRAMKENARQGYFNGSRPPFGYKTVETEASGSKGKRKKRIVIDPAEAAIVKKVFDLYLSGHSLGVKGIASHLNERGYTVRSRKWTHSRVHEILSNKTYIGEFYFNKRDMKNHRAKPEAEWVRMEVEPIIDQATFDQVQNRKASRAPDKVPPKVVGSPTLLTGLLKCGHCGGGMTLATGKGGRYRYYKCNTRISQGKHLCTSQPVSMEKLDSAVLHALADKVFTPERVKQMLKELETRIKDAQVDNNSHLKALTKELDELKGAMERLYEAVEKGFLPLDGSLQERSHKLQARRQDLLIEIAGFKRQQHLPLDNLKARQIEAFTSALRAKLLDAKSGFSKEYLRLLVKEIRLKGREAEITGGYAELAQLAAQTKMGTLGRVPTFVPNWLPDLDSNQGPAD